MLLSRVHWCTPGRVLVLLKSQRFSEKLLKSDDFGFISCYYCALVFHTCMDWALRWEWCVVDPHAYFNRPLLFSTSSSYITPAPSTCGFHLCAILNFCHSWRVLVSVIAYRVFVCGAWYRKVLSFRQIISGNLKRCAWWKQLYVCGILLYFESASSSTWQLTKPPYQEHPMPISSAENVELATRLVFVVVHGCWKEKLWKFLNFNKTKRRSRLHNNYIMHLWHMRIQVFKSWWQVP